MKPNLYSVSILVCMDECTMEMDRCSLEMTRLYKEIRQLDNSKTFIDDRLVMALSDLEKCRRQYMLLLSKTQTKGS